METCTVCGQTFTWKKSLTRHQKEKHGNQLHRCHHCSREFSRHEHLQKHMKIHRKRPASVLIESPALHTQEIDTNEDLPSTSGITEGPSTSGITEDPSTSGITDEELNDLMDYLDNNPLTEQRKSALKRFLTSYRLKYVNQQVDPIFFTNNLVDVIEKLIATEPHRGIKLWICLQIQFEKATDPSETINGFFCCKQKIILPGTDRIEMIQSAFPEILFAIDAFESKGSGWVIKQILHADVHFSKYQPLRGSNYKKLPKYLHDKHAIINPQNNDNRCFMWPVLAALHPIPVHSERVSNYSQYTDELSFCGISFPVSISQVKKFERQNHLSINVYGFEDKDVHPLYISKSTDQHIDLLFYDGHYSWIKNLDSLLYDQRKHKSKKYFCPRCLIPMYSEEARSDHLTRCGADPTRIKMPDAAELKFSNIQRMQRQPLLVYADFECLTEPTTVGHGNTQKYQRHIPCSYGLVESLSCCKQPTFSEPVIYRGDNSVRKFLLELIQIALAHQERLNQFPTLIMTNEDKERHKSFTCHICEKQILPNEKVRDHCHICGRYRGPAHNDCNQAFRLNRDVVVVFHNLRRYDGHLIMQHLGQICKDMDLDIQCVAKGLEDYIGFSIKSRPDKDRGESTGGDNDHDDPIEDEEKEHPWKLKFIDSFQFLTSSLEGLVNNLDKQKFKAMETQFNEEELKLLLRKGVFCYDWLNKWEKFDYPLPMKAQFYSKLNDLHISDEDYSHAKKVWNAFEMRTMGQYHDLYLKTDVLLLADVFEGFRSFCLENYKLDPAHYLTLPAFGWDACLKMTNITLQLLQDPEMYTFLESGIRGGISMISHRYARANNEEIEGYDPSKPRSYIIYLDANNLYGWSMVQALPTGEFEWVENPEELDWETIPDNNLLGYILEVDINYPESLHDSHNCYPLAAEQLTITDDILSPYCLSLKQKMNLKLPAQAKLVPNLFSKRKYVVHYRNLKFYKSQGLEITKVHRALKFQQSTWMSPYIMFNTRMRARATTPFEKDLFKLLNNAVFGKTMENVRNHKDIKLITRQEQFRKLAANPRYQYSTIFTEDLIGVNMKKASTCLCKPIYVGFSVLELSKELMYNFHYNYIKPKYGSKATLLFTDTDSLCYHVETTNIYADMFGDSHLFDTSDYPAGHHLHSNANKKVLGKMKDETAGSPITEFCGLRSKMYSFLCGGIEKKRAKGIKKSVVKNQITHSDFLHTLFNETSTRHSMILIRSERHEIYSMTLTKKSLSAYDDKRYLMDNLSSFAYGHNATM